MKEKWEKEYKNYKVDKCGSLVTTLTQLSPYRLIENYFTINDKVKVFVKKGKIVIERIEE